MIGRLLSGIISAAVLAACPVAASACDFVYPASAEERAADARRTIERSSVIIDAEVIRAPTPDRPALVRAVRSFKGPQQDVFEIAPRRTSCDLEMGGVGSRQRLFLTGGPDLWFARDTASDPVHEDRLLGSDRNHDWPFVSIPLGR